MSFDSMELRGAVGQFATGVTLITASVDERVHAMTANAFSSVSLEPPLVLCCISRKARMVTELNAATGFVVNLLRADQAPLSSYFAGAWKESPPPFRFVPWQGGFRLEGGLAALACSVHARVDAGDHVVVLGRVTALHQGIEPRRPLIFFGGRYHRLVDEAGTPAPSLEEVRDPPQPFYDHW